MEAGGTKFVCAVGDEKFQVVEKTQFPTTIPYETIDRTIEFFKRYEDQLAGIAIGSFGPIDVDSNSETYGFVTSTPKPHWSNIGLLDLIAKEFNIPFYITTDVNSSAYGGTLVRKGVKSLLFTTISELVLEPVLFKMVSSLVVWVTLKLATYMYLFTQMMFPMNLTELVHSTSDVWKVWVLVHHLKPVQVFVAN